MLQHECFVPHGDKDVPLQIQLPRTSSESIGLSPQIAQVHGLELELLPAATTPRARAAEAREAVESTTAVREPEEA